MDGDPRSYRVPVIRLSDVYTDEEESGAEASEVVTPWNKSAQSTTAPPATTPPPQQPSPAPVVKKEEEPEEITGPVVTLDTIQETPAVAAAQSPQADQSQVPQQTQQAAAFNTPPTAMGQGATPFPAPSPTPDPQMSQGLESEPATPIDTPSDTLAPELVQEDLLQKLRQHNGPISTPEPEPNEQAPATLWERAQAEGADDATTPAPSFSFGDQSQSTSDSLANAGLPSDDLPDIWEQASKRPTPAPFPKRKDPVPTPTENPTVSEAPVPTTPFSVAPSGISDTTAQQELGGWPAPTIPAQGTEADVPSEPTPQEFIPQTPTSIPTPAAPAPPAHIVTPPPAPAPMSPPATTPFPPAPPPASPLPPQPSIQPTSLAAPAPQASTEQPVPEKPVLGTPTNEPLPPVRSTPTTPPSSTQLAAPESPVMSDTPLAPIANDAAPTTNDAPVETPPRAAAIPSEPAPAPSVAVPPVATSPIVPKMDDVLPQAEPVVPRIQEEGVGTVPIRRAEPTAPVLEQTAVVPEDGAMPTPVPETPPTESTPPEASRTLEPSSDTGGVISNVMKAFGVHDTKGDAPEEQALPTTTPPSPPVPLPPAEGARTPELLSTPHQPAETETAPDGPGVLSNVMKAFGVQATTEQGVQSHEMDEARPDETVNTPVTLPTEHEFSTANTPSAPRSARPIRPSMDGVRTTPSAKDILMKEVHTPEEDDPLDMWGAAARKPKRPAPQKTLEPEPFAADQQEKEMSEASSSPWGIAPSSTPTHTPRDQNDDPLDMWGEGASSPETPHTPGFDDVEHILPEAGDLDSLDEDLAARDSLSPLPDSNDIYTKDAKKKDVTPAQPSAERPATGTSLSDLRERVLKQSVQDKAPVRKPVAPTPAGNADDLSATHGLVSGRTNVGTTSNSPAGPGTPHAKAIAGVAQELKNMGSGDTAKEKGHPSNVPKSHSSLPVVRTFRADVEAAVTQGKVSMVGMISAEEKRRSGDNGGIKARNVIRSRLSAKAYIMLGAALVFLTTILLVAGVIIYMVWVRPYLGSLAQSTVSTERMVSISIEGKSGSVILAELAALRDETQYTRGTMTEVRPYRSLAEDGSANERNRVPAPEFLRLVAPNTPPQLLGALRDEFVLGFHQTESSQAFLILLLKDDQFGPARAGMVAWERGMARELSPLFGDYDVLRESQAPTWFATVARPEEDGTATDTPQTLSPPPSDQSQVTDPVFRDHSVANIATRAIIDRSGNVHLLWSTTDQATVVIVTDPATLRDIQMRRGVGY